MNKKERVLAVVQGREPDRIPTGFWLHFPPDQQKPENMVAAHLKFFEESGTDICKVMNEALLRGNVKVTSPGDFAAALVSDETKRALNRQVDNVKAICDKIGDTALIQATIHGVVVSAHHLSLREGFYVDNKDFLRHCMTEDRYALLSAYDRVCDVLCDLTWRCVEAGAGGIYYACLGGEKDLFTEEEYHTYVEPYEQRVFSAASCASCFNTLHICKSGLDIARYTALPAQVVNWAIHENNPTLAEGARIFADKVILGGLDDRAGVLVDGTSEEIEAEVHGILEEMQGRRFILGADCTLPTEISCERIMAAVNACGSYTRG